MAGKRGRSDTHPRDRRARNRAREDKADGPDSHSSANQGEQTVLNRPVVNCPENRGMPGIPHHRGIHRPVRRVDQDSPGRFGIRTPANRGQWDVLNGWNIHSREERRNPAAQIRPGAHSSGDRHNRERPRSLVTIVTAFGLRSNQSRRVPDATDQRWRPARVALGGPKRDAMKLLQRRANWVSCRGVAVLTPGC